MKSTHKICGISPPSLWLAGVTVALILAIPGSCHWHHRIHSQARLRALDQQAAIYRQKASEAIPAVVADIANMRSLGKLSCFIVWDKIFHSNKAQNFIAVKMLPVTRNCAEIAHIYGIEPSLLQFSVDTGNTVSSMAYATGGLALEAVFMKATLRSLGRVSASATVRMAAAAGGGAACAAADGPFPIGDAVGVAIALGGTALSLYDLYQAYVQFPFELTALLQQQLDEFHQLCRAQVKL